MAQVIRAIAIRVGSHLFQRVASFLHKDVLNSFRQALADVLISFREWLHSYVAIYRRRSIQLLRRFSSLSESGFIPTSSFRHCAYYIKKELVLISFREWLHSYILSLVNVFQPRIVGSHLFQRVASFLHWVYVTVEGEFLAMFSSLSESGFIPTRERHSRERNWRIPVLISFREWLHSYFPKASK